MKLTKESKMIVFFCFFSAVLISLYLLDIFQKKNQSKIVLISETNPLEVVKPEPIERNMNLERINQVLKEIELQNNKSLEIDDIE